MKYFVSSMQMLNGLFIQLKEFLVIIFLSLEWFGLEERHEITWQNSISSTLNQVLEFLDWIQLSCLRWLNEDEMWMRYLRKVQRKPHRSLIRIYVKSCNVLSFDTFYWWTMTRMTNSCMMIILATVLKATNECDAYCMLAATNLAF